MNNKFISWTVVYAINFFKSVWDHIFIDESITPITANIKNAFKSVDTEKNGRKKLNRYTAVFTKKPLR